MVNILTNAQQGPKVLQCQHCLYEWTYKGQNPYVTICPHCAYKVRTNKVLGGKK